MQPIYILLLALCCQANLLAQQSPKPVKEINFFFLHDISKSALENKVPVPDTAELRLLLRALGTKNKVSLSGLYIQTNSADQELQEGPVHYLNEQAVEGGFITQNRIKKANAAKRKTYNEQIDRDVEGAYRFFTHPYDQGKTDITTALKYFLRYAEQPGNENVEFNLIINSDMLQDREDDRDLVPIILPDNVTVYIIGSKVGNHYDALFPNLEVYELIKFKAKYFISKYY